MVFNQRSFAFQKVIFCSMKDNLWDGKRPHIGKCLIMNDIGICREWLPDPFIKRYLPEGNILFHSAALKLYTGLMTFSTVTVSAMLLMISSFGLYTIGDSSFVSSLTLSV